MSGTIVTTFPSDIQEIIQQGYLDRAFLDALRPKLMFRRLATREEIPIVAGETVKKTRDGLVTPRVVPTTPGNPTPEISYTKEQWEVTPARWTGKKTTRLPNSAIVARNQFLKDSQKLAEHAGWSVDRVARNRLFSAYSGGDTLTVASAAGSQTAVKVASLAGFRKTETATGILTDVSSTNKLAVTVGSEGGHYVIATTPDDANYPDGPGTLTLAANLAGTQAVRSRVYAANKPYVALPSGVSTIDGLTSSSVVGYTQFLAAKRVLEENNVPKFSDGTYHCVTDLVHIEQFLNDTALRQFLQGVPDSIEAQLGVISKRIGITFVSCNETPKTSTCSGGLKGLYGNTVQAPEAGCELVNATSVGVRRSILIGADALMEGYIPEERYKAQTQGREGPFGHDGGFFDTTGGYDAMMDGIRLHIRPPIDDHGDEITQAYSLTADWVCPVDGTATSSSALYKRAVVLVSAGPA